MAHPSSPTVSSHEQVLGALEALDVGIAVYDAVDHLIFCNQRFRQLHMAVADLLLPGTPYERIVRESYRRGLDCPAGIDEDIYVQMQLDHHREPSGIARKYRLSDGTQLHITDRATTAGGVISSLLHVNAQESKLDRHDDEKKSDDSVRRLEKMSSQLMGMVYEFELYPDGSYRFAYASAGAKPLFRAEPEALMADADVAFRYLHSDDIPMLWKLTQVSAQHLSPFRAEFRIQWEDGTIEWRHAQSVPERDPDGVITWVGFVTDISERKRVDMALREREFLLQQAQQLAQLGSLWWDLNTQNGYWSDQAYRIFGVSKSLFKPTYSNFMALLHPDDRDLEKQARVNAISGHIPYDIEFRHYTPDGELRYAHGRAEAIHDGSSGQLKLVCSVQDITNRKRSEEALRKSHDLLDQLGQRVPGMLYQFQLFADGRSCFPYASQGITNIFGVMAAAVREDASALLKTIHPHDVDRVLSSIKSSSQRLGNWHEEFRINHPVRGTISVIGNAHAERLADQSILWHGYITDITAEHVAEEQRRTLAMRLELATSSANVGIWEWDTKNDTIFWDKTMFRLYGVDPDHFAYDYQAWVQCLHPDDVAGAQREIEIALLISTVYDSEFRIQRPDGITRYMRACAKVERDANGCTTRLIGTTWDITEVRAAENMRLEKEAAEIANRAKTEFLARMSHELRTPLNSIMGFGQLLATDDTIANSETLRQRVQYIRTASSHLLAIINDILDLSRIESGVLPITLEPVSVTDCIHECVALLNSEATQRQVTLDITSQLPDGCRVLADTTRFRQILLNLLSNAIKYNHAGGNIKLTAIAQQGWISLAIQDTGIGLTPEQVKLLFQPFKRLGANQARVEGTGIGLYITKKLVEKMNGEIEIISEPQKGSTFTVRLPEAMPAAAAVNLPQKMGKPLDTPHRIYTLLYVEDNETNIELMQQLLAMRPNISLQIARNGKAGIQLAVALSPDFVLLDINLPDLDGFQVQQALAANPLTRDIPCIALSANAMPDQVQYARQAGFVDYWTKPINLSQFLSGMDAFLTTIQPRQTPK